MKSWFGSFVVTLLFSLCTSSVNADAVRVIAAGDSITDGYAYQRMRLQRALDTVSIDCTAMHAAYSGRKAQDFINEGGINATLDKDPDVILLMLGTNDALRASFSAPDTYFDDYTLAMSSIFEAVHAFTNTRGESPEIILLNLIPVIDKPALPGSVNIDFANQAIEAFNTWLEQQAQQHGYSLFDTYTLITSQPDWQDMYNDGIHLWGDDERGYDLMADQLAQQVETVMLPEPIAASSLMILLATTRLRQR
ncbi:SGNH/GDSL hydrolase family protein [Mucisphaera calidilacus]|uniref:GDSL-like Lipase/Acylhydrolase n=1 Tax=Mucisphaera calidilacus TaxID=2527982 RepID=A0A518BWL8_9BACT|nr:SGNH/GDSL hydrolase family protein [Mucisphaera calidilacus]QDU71369.1 GDSL-like Lipase/Acylhydrolase [Mucisphaera calidilacus]